MKNIALVMGGFSGEHDISIASGNQVYTQLDHSRYNVYKIVVERQGWYWLSEEGEHLPIDRSDFSVIDRGHKVRFDLAFIIIHGNPGENGVLQGYFDLLGVRYTTCGFYTTTITFHKGYCNAFVRETGVVKVAPSVLLYKGQEYECSDIAAKLGMPVFVKPATGGSSVATTKVKCVEDLQAAIEEAFTEADEVMIEQFVKGREFDCGVFRYQGKTMAFPITEIIPTDGHEFFDYEAKYQGFSNEVTPADCPKVISELIQRTSSELYALLNCRGIVRFDYIYDEQHETLYFLEVNTIPGQSAESIVPKQAKAMGITPAQLYDMAIQEALS